MDPTTHLDVVICGMPNAGKTTYLAAMWHLVSSGEIEDIALVLKRLEEGDNAYLTEIARVWRKAVDQEHTKFGVRNLISLLLADKEGKVVRLRIPDLYGESYKSIWKLRQCDEDIAELIRNACGILLAVNVRDVSIPLYAADFGAQVRELGEEPEEEEGTDWDADNAPTMVQVVDLLQCVLGPTLNSAPRKVGILLTAWDQAPNDTPTPMSYMEKHLALLRQFLENNLPSHLWGVYGISAQGGDNKKEADVLLKIDMPSKKIRVVSADGTRVSHDLTEPVAWLMSP